MTRQLKKWALRLTVTGFFLAGLLLMIILNPGLVYAGQSTHEHFSIFHHQALDPLVYENLDQAAELLQTSEFYNSKLQLEICLNDGSFYPDMVETLRGKAFAWGFYDKVVLQGEMDGAKKILTLNGYQWNLPQLLAHEMTHCLQFDQLGFWHSNPVANIPDWKWEGYAEYIARQKAGQKDLEKNIDRLLQTTPNTWAITFDDGTIAPSAYYQYWIMVQYCMNERKMTYRQLLEDQTIESEIKAEMMDWYQRRKE